MLQEFFVTTTRKIPKPLDTPAAVRIIDDLAHWHVHAPAAGDVLAAIGIHQRTGASFWDAMILRGVRGHPGVQTVAKCHVLLEMRGGKRNTVGRRSPARVERPYLAIT